jgi:hypothetical protein
MVLIPVVLKLPTLLLVGGIPTPSEKYEFVSWDHDIANIFKNKIHFPIHPDIDV